MGDRRNERIFIERCVEASCYQKFGLIEAALMQQPLASPSRFGVLRHG